MTITAKFSTICPCCNGRISAGDKVEWTKGTKARHVACAGAPGAASAPSRAPGRNWNPDRFNGYGRRRGGYSKACVSDGNCSSIGSGRSCGGHDCDGY